MEKKIDFKGKKALIFDLDGTIVKLKANWNDIKSKISKKFNMLYGTDHSFSSITHCLDALLERGGNEELPSFFKIIEENELKNINQNEYMEETLFFIKNLTSFNFTNETKIAVFSLNMRNTIIRSLELGNIRDKVHFFIGREDVRRWKPNPDGLIKIQEEFKLDKEELIYFGDLKKDIETGKNAGIDAYLISELIDLVKEKRNKIT